MRHSRTEGDPLLFASGELARIGTPAVAQSDLFEQLVGAALPLCAFDSVQPELKPDDGACASSGDSARS